MSAQPAYRAYPERVPARDPRTRVRVVPGRAPRREPAKSTSPVRTVTLAIVVAVVAVTLVAFLRVTLAAATVTTAMQSQDLESQISDARSTGSSLEVSQSLLSSPTRVRQEAERLGMATPSSVETMTLPQDVVQTNDDGSLSLSKSVAVVAGTGE